MTALLDRYPLEDWEIQWSASYSGNIWGCVLVHPQVAGQMLGDIRNYLDRPSLKESILKHGTTYGPSRSKDAKHILMTAETMRPMRQLLGIEENNGATALVQAHISKAIASDFKAKCKRGGFTQRQVLESLLSDWRGA
jgi:aminopeptidase-like protein